jgi:formyl-CoA transferase
VNDVRQALDDEQVRARDMIVEVEHPEFGTLKEVRSPIRTEGEVRTPRRGPRLGEDTDAILSELLGYGAATIAGLRTRGVIG